MQYYARKSPFNEKTEPLIIFTSIDGKISSYFPLVIKEKSSGKKVAINAGEGLWGYSGFVINGFEYETFNLIFEYLKSLGVKKITLGPLHEALIAKYSEIFNLFYGYFRQIDGAPCLKCKENIEGYKLKVQKDWKNTERCLNKLKQIGEVELLTLSNLSTEDEIKKAILIYIEIHKQQWPLSKFNNKDTINFFISLAIRTIHNQLDFKMLIVNKEVISVHYGFNHNHRYYYLGPAYNKNYREYSPGKILLNEIINECFESSLLLDFQNSEDVYKLQYTNTIAKRFFFEIKI